MHSYWKNLGSQIEVCSEVRVFETQTQILKSNGRPENVDKDVPDSEREEGKNQRLRAHGLNGLEALKWEENEVKIIMDDERRRNTDWVIQYEKYVNVEMELFGSFEFMVCLAGNTPQFVGVAGFTWSEDEAEEEFKECTQKIIDVVQVITMGDERSLGMKGRSNEDVV
ncbi:hypothetical protein Tco_0629022 [Tanacetum coccineum]|uniref:Uncharacterized protein n=1 Tax=Tanacetum coccineum TaxID=301880 RepID=A0ABQ4WRX7_9ASTR